jgi:hypothetical protein
MNSPSHLGVFLSCPIDRPAVFCSRVVEFQEELVFKESVRAGTLWKRDD